MAGLVQAIHVVRRIERAQAASKGEKPCFCKSLQRTTPIPDSSLRQGGVDGRDKPGHDDKAQRRNRQKPNQQLTGANLFMNFLDGRLMFALCSRYRRIEARRSSADERPLPPLKKGNRKDRGSEADKAL
jgi:hypothetical protein